MFKNGDSTHVNGPDLPIPRRSHCSVRVDPGNDYWILGGRIGDYENANYSGVYNRRYFCTLDHEIRNLKDFHNFSSRNFASQ